jgi:hypothetical protein
VRYAVQLVVRLKSSAKTLDSIEVGGKAFVPLIFPIFVKEMQDVLMEQSPEL